ncbi:MAG: bifunctional enoyl-CoA hydratase/phosphate acetyltransferase [Bacteroidales bacterium]|nr:bifunctional enoyl-CoA hydratase/phosphate acetyltransferase [Bacteroidales bacterium]MBN2820177.1 bifunctional enoyl-CoA hydratase/phosphate acetyltransferase [Bacteroidales bacterium]
MISTLNTLLDKAKKSSTKKLAIAAAHDIYVLSAINTAHKLGLIAPIFVGNKEEIIKAASEAKINIDSSNIVDTPDSDTACAKAVQLVHSGHADILMKGLVSTGTLLKHVVSKEYGLVDNQLLSHLAVFESPMYHKLLGVTDAAMNIAPSLEEKKSIINNAINAFREFGIEKPKVALLTAVEKVNVKMPATIEAAELKAIFLSENKPCYVDGPLALDNAISKKAAEHKNIGGPVAGDADILVAPDIEAGNILYKSLSFLGKSRCAAIVLGSKAPIVLTSRADNEETKFFSIVLGVLLSK